jgi:two-component system response regulator HupR/HoxA
MPSPSIGSTGSPFRAARLRCSLVGAETRWEGCTRLVGACGAQVVVDARPLCGSAAIRDAERVSIVLTSAEGARLEVSARVAWWEPDAGNAEHLLVGVELATPDSIGWRALVASLRPVVLVVDGDSAHVTNVRLSLGTRYRVLSCSSAAEAMGWMDREEISVVLVDQRLSDASGTSFLRELSGRFPDSRASRLMASAWTKAEEVQDLINLGRIFHYLRKPVVAGELLQAVDRGAAMHALAMENDRLARELRHANQRLRRENASLKERLQTADDWRAGMIGKSPSFLRAVRDLDQVGTSGAAIHIAGETGTGKELVARALHGASGRADQPFIAQNCAALPDTLIQSALFGHARGAFTGADRAQSGLFQAAHRGTLFLDEVAELSMAAQAALLRVLQDGEVLPVGSSRPVRVDVRVLSATHRNLRAEVAAGRFREDLYFRLVVVLLQVPPLRERRSDIALLANHFLQTFSRQMSKPLPSFTPGALHALESYPWPGNVRELRNEVERAVVLGRPDEPVAAELLSEHIRSLPDTKAAPQQPADCALPRYDDAVRALERNLVEEALARSGGVVSRAAEALGIERTRLTKLRQRLGIHRA